MEGAALPLSAMDQGWQDTVIVAPNQSISIIAPFDMAGDYVWHCHILSHEEHDMMRPLHGPPSTVIELWAKENSEAEPPGLIGR